MIALCSGGSGGTAGDYEFFEVDGAIRVDDGYNLTIAQSSSSIAKVGTTGTAEVKTSGLDPYITIVVTGQDGISIEWFASVQITEKKLKTGGF